VSASPTPPAKRKPPRPTRLTEGDLPDSGSLIEVYKVGTRLAKTATANAWGVLGGIIGDLAGSIWLRFDKTPLLSRWELFMITYAVAVAVYTLFSRSTIGVRRCLGFAEMMFSDQQISLGEYKQVRHNCLKRGGFIGDS